MEVRFFGISRPLELPLIAAATNAGDVDFTGNISIGMRADIQKKHPEYILMHE